MALTVLPTLAGLTWDIKRTPVFSTRNLTARSGLEYRTANWSYPRYKFEMSFSVLRTAAAYQEFQSLVGFINSVAGQYANFLYNDTNTPDNSVTTQAIGVGDGTTTVFPLVRSYGGYSEPVLYANVISAVYLNGVSQATPAVWSGYQSGAYGVDSIKFVSAPTAGVVITATFTYYFVCRLTSDENEFNNFMSGRFEMKKLSFESVK